jgi:hypothetical protein
VDNTKCNLSLSPFKDPSVQTSIRTFATHPTPFAGNTATGDAGIMQGDNVVGGVGGLAVYATTDPDTLLILGAFKNADNDPAPSAKAMFVPATTAITIEYAIEVEKGSYGIQKAAEHEFKGKFNPFGTGAFKLSVSIIFDQSS